MTDSIPNASAKTWENWSGNIRHLPPTDGAANYFAPRTLDELQAILKTAETRGATIRVSGQRHSQPPLVAQDNRDAAPATAQELIVDMSCYIDIGDTGMRLGDQPNQVVVNAGVREDQLDAFLAEHKLMMKTVTAGGFFSVGGMTAVDVNGATLDQPIFAETVAAFTLLRADGTLETISDDGGDGLRPIDFMRVSLGAMGIVTQITLNVEPRTHANQLIGSHKRYKLLTRDAFIAQFKALFSGPQAQARMEVFYTPYAAADNLPPLVPKMANFLVLGWAENPQPDGPPPTPQPAPTACELAGKGDWGAPSIGGLADATLHQVGVSQYENNAYYPPLALPPIPPSGFAAIALDQIEKQMDAAIAKHSDLWLAKSEQVMFMSYFLEMPDLSEAGFGLVWDALDLVAQKTIQDGAFHIAAPMEFRFMRGGRAAMAGTYTERPDATFVNLDLIGFIDPTPSSQYNAKLLDFFADIEREWVAMGGFPHNGKMYGFYDPSGQNTEKGAFNPGFLADLRKRRGKRLEAFRDYQAQVDPSGRFLNPYVRSLIGA